MTPRTAPHAPDVIHELVERFARDRADYRAGKYNEARVRQEYLDPFFEALGWDVANRKGYAEAYKDVIVEDALRISGKHKAPDYSFRIGGSRKFFVEAKQPAVDLANDPVPALQVRRYAWSAKLPLSILTDFEELAVYDCRIKPEPRDRAATARTMLVPYTQYIARWDEIHSRFSRDAVLKGAFDAYTESAARKRGTTEVDSVFLNDLRRWRELLALNIAKRNRTITERELNFAVQQLLDRLVFLRICEDRQIEEYGRLRQAASGKGAYERLVQLFTLAEDKYNSGLFHFKAEKGRMSEIDAVTPGLAIDDTVLKDIVKHLYYPDSPYEFSVVSSDILGQVYEQFLGQVIHLGASGRAEVEDKPAVRKAGGVFYTPIFIVDYIVKRTVGRLVEGKTPRDVALLRILDPACGSGSFLIAVFQFLLDWHLTYYLKDGPEKHAKGRPPRVYQSTGGAWRLTGDEKKRILLNNIYGVDIDPQAVEVTKLSLVLKVLEGETEESLGSQLGLFQDRVLPDLGNNIKCGNSLIAPQDFYTGQQRLLEDEEQYRVNPFDWKAEFPQVFRGPDPGFDVVLGNPPYIRIQTMKEWAPLEVEFYKQRYKSAGKGNYDIYVVFVERGLELLNSRGRLGYILPHKFFNAQYGEGLRRIIAEGQHLSEVVHFGAEQVFGQATTYTALIFLDRHEQEHFRYVEVDDLQDWQATREATERYVPAALASDAPWNFGSRASTSLVSGLNASLPRLGEVASIFVGLQTSADKIYILKSVASDSGDGDTIIVEDMRGQEWEIERAALRPLIHKSTVTSFERPEAGHWLVFPYSLESGKAMLVPRHQMIAEFPLAWRYLLAHEAGLRGRESGKADHDAWYGYIYRKNLTLFDGSKLIVQVISQRARYALDEGGLFFTGGGNGPYYGIRWLPSYEHLSLHYLQALLTCSLLDEYLQGISTPFRGGYWSYSKRYLSELPIRIPGTNAGEQQRYQAIVNLAQNAQQLKRQHREARTDHERQILSRSIDAQLGRLDGLVNELYGASGERDSADHMHKVDSSIDVTKSTKQEEGGHHGR